MPQRVQATEADYYMKQYRVIVSDPQGEAQLWIDGDELIHYPNNITTIAEPYVTVRAQSRKLWSTEADQGKIVGEEQITLDGSVQIQQVSESQQPITMETDNLVISITDKIATTDEKIKLNTPQGTLTATGLFFDLENSRVKLISDVSATYVNP